MNAPATMPLRLCSMFLLALIAASMLGCPRSPDAPEETLLPIEARITDDDIALNNRGVGLMGRYEYETARQIFAQLVERHPDWLDVRVNLAIATLNRQVEGDEEKALAMLDEVLETDPDHLRAQFCSGLLRLYLDAPERAMEHFRFVADRDPEDAYAAYYVAQSYAQQRDYEAAHQWFERALRADPYLRSAYYGKFQALQRLGRTEEAEAMLDAFDRLKDNPRARLVEFVYTRMGPKGEAIAIGRPDPEKIPPPEGPVFAAPRSILPSPDARRWRAPYPARPTSITICDLTGNGELDIFIAGVIDHVGASNAVLINQGEGRFSLDLDHPLARVDRVHAPLWGDIDNSGLTDVYLLRDGPNQLWRQTAPGQWEDITGASGTANESYNSVDGIIFDADHDGDLDLFIINADGPNELLNNNLDGTFRPLGAEHGIAGDGRASRLILAADLETDRDLDLIVLNDDPPHEVYLNDRLWQYREADGFDQFREAPIVAAVVGDLDVTRQAEIYTLNKAHEVHRWDPDENGIWRPTSLGNLERDLGFEPPHHERVQLALADVTGDGTMNLIVSLAEGWTALDLRDGALDPVFTETDRPLRGWAVAHLDPARGPSIIGLTLDESPDLLLWPPGPGRHEFLALAFTGKEDAGQSMRSNASGIGTYFAARVGSRWTAGMVLRQDTGPGQSLQPMSIGLGGADRVDFIHIDWSDGVFQSEIDLVAGQLHTIAETQRQLASCPVLFAWNGERYEFVSDVLGVGGIGFAVGPGEYAPPRPWERFLMPHDLLQPKRGRYILKLGEPMEEACYLDSARLVAYDVPPGWFMTVDDRMYINDPAPTGEVRFYRSFIHASRAFNDRGEDLTDILRRQDYRAAPVGEHDRRFIGRLMQDNVITLEFDQPLDSFDGQPILIADGWIEYPYSQTAFAAWQAGADYRAPTIEAQGADGAWRTILREFGYPAGFPREMSVPLPDLPPSTTALRISTNQEIYWDRLMVAFTEDCPDAARLELDLVEATLNRTGFAQRILFDQRRAYYDYDQRLPLWDTRHQAGFYTEFGPVKELIRETNNALAIFGPGEEIHMEFRAPESGPPEGWTRRFVFETDGWCKDMDLYTLDGETLEPLPSLGLPGSPRELLHRAYNTRYRSGR